MAVGETQNIQWRLPSGRSIVSAPMQNVENQRDRLMEKGVLVWDTEKGVPFLEVPIEDREIIVTAGEPKVAEHYNRSTVARNLFAYKNIKGNWLKRSAKVLLVQKGAYKVASEVETDVKIVRQINLLARKAFVSKDAEAGQVGQIVSTSIGGAITLLGLAGTVAEFASDAVAYRKGSKKVKAANYAEETYQLARQNLDATVDAQLEMIAFAREEAQRARAGRILGEEMCKRAKGGIAVAGISGGVEVADLVATGLELSAQISPVMESSSVISSVTTGIGVVSSFVLLPLHSYSMYSNLTSMDEHLATKEAAKNLCEEYGIGPKKDPELELIGNLVKERQAYKGKGFTAGMSALKILGSVVGLVAAAGTIFAASGTVAATAFAIMTPIGWTISAGATLGLIGYGLYKVGKCIHRRMEINELNKFAAHTSSMADPDALPELSEKQQNRLNALRQKAVQTLAVELDRMPTDEEVESKVHVDMVERLLKVDADFAAQVLFVRFQESILSYATSSGKTIDELNETDFISAGGGSEFLAKMGSFDTELLRAIAHSDTSDPGDAIRLIKKRLHI